MMKWARASLRATLLKALAEAAHHTAKSLALRASAGRRVVIRARVTPRRFPGLRRRRPTRRQRAALHAQAARSFMKAAGSAAAALVKMGVG